MDEKKNYIYDKNPIKEKLKYIKTGTIFIRKGIQKSNISEILDKAKSKNIEIVEMDNENFKKFFGTNNSGIVLKIDEEFINSIDEKEFLENVKEKSKSIILILDGIKDVGNFGAILRSSLLFNVDGVILPKNNSAPVTEVVVKRSAGAVFHINVIYATNIVRTIEELKKIGYWVYASDIDGESLIEVGFHEKSVLVFGEEGRGIRKLVKENCDVIVKIPTNNKLDSLNLSVSAGIILYELNKKFFFIQ